MDSNATNRVMLMWISCDFKQNSSISIRTISLVMSGVYTTQFIENSALTIKCLQIDVVISQSPRQDTIL